MSSFLFRLGQRCARHPFRVLGVWLLIAVAVLGAQLPARRRPPRTTSPSPASKSQAADDLLEERFPSPVRRRPARSCSTSTTGRIDDPPNQAAIEAALDRAAPTATTSPASPTPSTPRPDGQRRRHDRVRRPSSTPIDAARAEHTDEADAAVEHRPRRRHADRALRRRSPPPAGGRGQRGASAWSSPSIVLLVAFGSVIAHGHPDRDRAHRPRHRPRRRRHHGRLRRHVPVTSTMLGLDDRPRRRHRLRPVRRHPPPRAPARGHDVADAAGTANATAGQAVLFAGMTVVIAIVGLRAGRHPGRSRRWATPSPSSCIVAMAIAVTLLPALPRAGRARRSTGCAIHRRKDERRGHETVSGRWAAPRRPATRGATPSAASSPCVAHRRARCSSLRIGFADDGNEADDHDPAQGLRPAQPTASAPASTVRCRSSSSSPSGDDAAAARARSATPSPPTPASPRCSPPLLNEAGDTAVLTGHPDDRRPRTRPPQTPSTGCATRCSRPPSTAPAPTP